MAAKWEHLKLIRQPKVVKSIRASTLARYYWCSVQSYLSSLGFSAPHSEAMSRGTKVHKDIRDARQDSKWEAAFLAELEEFFEEREGDPQKVLARTWKDVEIYGEFVTHDIDEFRVFPNRTVQIIEYKSKKSAYIRPTDTAPAIFQNKIYAWILEPIIALMNYHLIPGLVIYTNTKGKATGETQPIFYDYVEIESDIERILYQFNNTDALIPPKRWKCRFCPEVYKSRCPFQGGRVP